MHRRGHILNFIKYWWYIYVGLYLLALSGPSFIRMLDNKQFSYCLNIIAAVLLYGVILYLKRKSRRRRWGTVNKENHILNVQDPRNHRSIMCTRRCFPDGRVSQF